MIRSSETPNDSVPGWDPGLAFRAAEQQDNPVPPAPKKAFTLVEVMVASIVLILGITTAITTLQQGFRAVDTARNFTYAAQIMQSELERLRLKSWSQLEDLQASSDQSVSITGVRGTAAATFSCQRSIRSLKTDMKEITLVSTWRGIDGRAHTVRYLTRYAKTGLYDYFYTSH
jgi:hypothetical protein